MTPGNRRDFNCPWKDCGRTFSRKSDLIRHYRIHTNERPYRCTFKDCNKSFIQRSALTVHSRTHTGEKPHICDHKGCHRAFSDSSSLARHRRIHTGHRPYVCQEPMCQRSFCRKTTLTRHRDRFHSTRAMSCAPSGNFPPDRSYLLRTTTITHGQYLPAQQLNFQPASTSTTHMFYSPQSIITPADVQHVQQHYIWLAQQGSDSTRPVFGSLEFQPAFQAGIPPIDLQALMLSSPGISLLTAADPPSERVRERGAGALGSS